MLLKRGAPLIAAETFAEMTAVPTPGWPAESSRSRPGTSGLVAGVRSARRQGAALDRGEHLAATLSHFGASGTLFFADPAAGVGLVCLANRGTYSGWMMRPGHWPDLCAA